MSFGDFTVIKYLPFFLVTCLTPLVIVVLTTCNVLLSFHLVITTPRRFSKKKSDVPLSPLLYKINCSESNPFLLNLHVTTALRLYLPSTNENSSGAAYQWHINRFLYP